MAFPTADPNNSGRKSPLVVRGRILRVPWQKSLAECQCHDFARAAANSQINRATADAAIFDQILFALRSIYFKAEGLSAMRADNISRNNGLHWLRDFDFVAQPHPCRFKQVAPGAVPYNFGSSYQMSSDFLAAATSSLRKCSC